MRKRLVVATGNRKKGMELLALLGPGWEVTTLADHPGIGEIAEDGDTFAANAATKAVEVSRKLGGLALGDDSGLEVDALGGAPGVHSARYAGPARDDAANNRKLLDAMKDVPEGRRGAQFHCVIAVAMDGRLLFTTEGVCRGRILTEPRGTGGFGYDPLFVPDGGPPGGLAFAEIAAEIKNGLSHRAQAMGEAVKRLAGM